jgi:hypothetical protein
MKNAGLFLIVLAGLLIASPASASIVSGINTHSGYGVHNSLHQWEFADSAGTSRALGRVDLDAKFGYNIKGKDLAMLSDGRVAVAHRDSGDTKWQISVLAPVYDGGGLLTDVNIDATFDSAIATSYVAPLPNAGFVVVTGSNAAVYQQIGPSSWSPTTGTINSDTGPWDVAGLVTGTAEFVSGFYSDAPPAGNAPRTGWKYGVDSDSNGAHELLARYYDSNYGNKGWPYNGQAEGLRSDLLANGWITSTDSDTTNIGSVIFDGTETDGAWHDGNAVGEILNSDGTKVEDKLWAATSDGRVVASFSGGWLRSDTDWRVYTLIEDPNLQPAGSIGATGEDYEVTLGDGTQGAATGVFVGRIAGDYMAIPEPATLMLMGG